MTGPSCLLSEIPNTHEPYTKMRGVTLRSSLGFANTHSEARRQVFAISAMLGFRFVLKLDDSTFRRVGGTEGEQ